MLVNVLLDCYGKTFSIVKWAGSYSRCISAGSGIRQGGILSPLLTGKRREMVKEEQPYPQPQ